MFRSIAASPSKTMLTCALAVLAANFVHAWDELPWLPSAAWAMVVAFSLVAVLGARRASGARLACLLVALTCGTWWRFESVLSTLSSAPGAEYRGTVVREPSFVSGKARLFMADVTSDGQPVRQLMVTARGAGSVLEGDDVVWRCRVDKDPLEGFCTVEGAINVVGHRSHPFLALRAKLRTVARTLMPEPDSSLLLGLIVGDRGGLPQDLIADFRATGTSHVLAVSGYNVMLVVDASIVFFALLGLSRRRAALAVAACVIGFVLLAGADPPVMRAGIMGSVTLLAALLGRRSHGKIAFALTAALMLTADPLAIRHDVSFRLSFFAVAGLSAFGGPLSERMRFIPFDGVRSALGETLGATIATLPIALYDFGSLAIASPLTNVMIAPLVPFATAIGAASVAVAFVSPTLAMPFAFVTAVALRFMRVCVSWWADVMPAITLQAGFWAAVAMYAGLIALWWVLRVEPSSKRV